MSTLWGKVNMMMGVRMRCRLGQGQDVEEKNRLHPVSGACHLLNLIPKGNLHMLQGSFEKLMMALILIVSPLPPSLTVFGTGTDFCLRINSAGQC